MWRSHDGMGWWMLFGGLWALVLWVLLIGLVVRIATTASFGRARRREPIDIARERYARGEIGRDEFERIRQDLETPAGP